MSLRHPLHFVPSNLRKPLFWFSLGLTAACFAVFQILLDPPLKTPLADGIVSYEFARTPQAATAMVESWDSRGRLFAAFSLGFDFLFMPLYATALSLGLLLAAERHQGTWLTLSNLLGWGAYLAIVFDAIENIALFSILAGNLGANPPLAFWCATIKFGLIALGLGYALAGRLVRAWRG
ncbi:MAG: hypothetical protein Fur0016_21310 [Anaerolineales bacterium]